jgi:HlyD family secretion protein
VDGEIARIVLHEGELAATGYPILTIVTIDAPWASFAVREDLLKELKVGTRVTAEVPALGRTVEFEVYSIAAMGDFATWKATNAKDSFDLKTFEVKARPTAKIEGLRPGMTVRWTRG